MGMFSSDLLVLEPFNGEMLYVAHKRRFALVPPKERWIMGPPVFLFPFSFMLLIIIILLVYLFFCMFYFPFFYFSFPMF